MSLIPEFPVLLNVNLIETEDHCDVVAEIKRFRARSVNVSAWQDTLVVEMQVDNDSEGSYYLGEADPKLVRRLIPLNFQVDPSQVLTHFKGGVLKVYVAKLKDESTSDSAQSRSYS